MSITLLDAVQRVMTRLNQDDVNSINELPEALSVASVIVQVYRDMISGRTIPINRRLIQLNASSDNTQPTHMKLPEAVSSISDMTIRYNKALQGADNTDYQKVQYLAPEDFLDLTNSRRSSASDVSVVTDTLSQPGGVSIMVLNDTAPEYYTSFDDTWLIFDAYDSSIDDCLQQSKTQAHAELVPKLVIADDTILPLPPAAESLLINKAFIALYEQEEGGMMYATREIRKLEGSLATKAKITPRIKLKPLYR